MNMANSRIIAVQETSLASKDCIAFYIMTVSRHAEDISGRRVSMIKPNPDLRIEIDILG
jgi:hypothetical protein